MCLVVEKDQHLIREYYEMLLDDVITSKYHMNTRKWTANVHGQMTKHLHLLVSWRSWLSRDNNLMLDNLNQWFGCNDDKKTMEMDSKQVLELWIKQHPLRFYTSGKPFPLFPRLETIFGKDRATGSYVISGNDADEQLEIEDEEQMSVNDVDMFESDFPL